MSPNISVELPPANEYLLTGFVHEQAVGLDHQVRLLADNLKGVQSHTAHPLSIGPFTIVDPRMRL
jgi:hypothetical protein